MSRPAPAPVRHIKLAAIICDDTAQIRVKIDPDVVAEYRVSMEDGDEFPPIVVFEGNREFYLADGWHRVMALKENGVITFPCEIHQGGREAAIDYALSANARHGLPRTNADKRRAVRIASNRRPEATDRELARLCAVSHTFVAQLRRPKQAKSVATVATPAPVTTDSARLAEWVKAHAAGMPVAEIARSYKVSEEDVRGALQLPQPETTTRAADRAEETRSEPSTATTEPASEAPAAPTQSSPSPEETPTPAATGQPAAVVKETSPTSEPVKTEVWSLRAAVERFATVIGLELYAAPEPMLAELKKALLEECGKLCGAPEAVGKSGKPVSVERQIYDAYPRKVAPKAALKAIAAALKACAGEEPSAAAYLLDRTVRFTEAVNSWPARDHKFIPHPATWFNRGSYADDPSEWQRGEQEGHGKGKAGFA